MKIALIAHDGKKADMVAFVMKRLDFFKTVDIVATGTTGTHVENAGLNVIKMKSGPLGGDAQIASLVVTGDIDMCVFLIDDLSANPHEADIQMLLRQCRIHNIPVACNRHSADLMITSGLWGTDYKPSVPTYQTFERK